MRPSSPAPPCRAMKTTSTSRISRVLLVRASAEPRRSASASLEGGCGATPAVSSRVSACAVSRPVAVSTAITSWPRLRRAGTICAALAIDTSRSSLVPPNKTAIFMTTLSPCESEPRELIDELGPLIHQRSVDLNEVGAGFEHLARTFERGDASDADDWNAGAQKTAQCPHRLEREAMQRPSAHAARSISAIHPHRT